MPVTKTAKRALRKSRKNFETNKKLRHQLKDLTKKVRRADDDANGETLLVQTTKALDKAAKKKLIHPNTAARMKSRLTKRLHKKEATPKAPAAVKTKKIKTKAKANR